MSLALFFSGCNHYKSIHFAAAKIQHIFHSATKKYQRPFLPPHLTPSNPLSCHLPPLQLSQTSNHTATLVLPIVFVVKRKMILQRRKHTLPYRYFMPQCKPQVAPLKGSHLSASGSEPTANLQRTFTGPTAEPVICCEGCHFCTLQLNPIHWESTTPIVKY